MEKHRFLLAALSVCGLLAGLIWGGAMSGVLYDVVAEAYAMMAILALLGLARRYLNIQNKLTGFFSSSSFGVYVFHQSWIVAVAYYVFGFTQAPALQIVLVLLLSVPLTFLTCAVFRRFRITRFMFGLKG